MASRHFVGLRTSLRPSTETFDKDNRPCERVSPDGGDLRENDMAETLLDARGLKCPLPILRAHKAFKDVAIGDALRVLSTDALSLSDFADFCRAAGAELVEARQQGSIYNILIRRLI